MYKQVYLYIHIYHLLIYIYIYISLWAPFRQQDTICMCVCMFLCMYVRMYQTERAKPMLPRISLRTYNYNGILICMDKCLPDIRRFLKTTKTVTAIAIEGITVAMTGTGEVLHLSSDLHMCVQIYIHTYICMYVCIHTYTHICTHTCMHRYRHSRCPQAFFGPVYMP